MRWITISTFFAAILLNGCDKQANPLLQTTQGLNESVQLDVVNEANECMQKGRYTSCWHFKNPCLWYDDIFNPETGRAGQCMLDCSRIKNKADCDKNNAWHCDWDTLNAKCIINWFETKQSYDQHILNQKIDNCDFTTEQECNSVEQCMFTQEKKCVHVK